MTEINKENLLEKINNIQDLVQSGNQKQIDNKE